MDVKEVLEENKRLRLMLGTIAKEKIPGPFICGESGEVRDGLHDSYSICPLYGSDIVAIYRRVE